MFKLSQKHIAVVIVGLSTLSLADEALVDEGKLAQARTKALSAALKQVANGEKIDEDLALTEEQFKAIQNTLQPNETWPEEPMLDGH